MASEAQVQISYSEKQYLRFKMSEWWNRWVELDFTQRV